MLHATRRWGSIAAAATALVVAGLLGLVGSGSALADSPITSGTSCVANDTTGCLQGKVIDDNRNPVPGAKITVTAPSGATDSAKTAKNGSFFFAVTEAGAYKVDLDAASLPKGVTPKLATLTVTVELSNISPAGFALNGHVKGSVNSGPAAVPLYQLVWQQFSQGLLLGLLLALAAIGLSLIYGTTGLSNFAHSEQITLGGFLAYVFAVQLGLNIVVAALLVIACTALSGYLQDKLIWGPLRKRGLGLTQLMIVTIGLSLALEYIFQLIFGARVYPVATDLELNTGPLDITPVAYWSMLVSIVVLALVGLALTFTRLGRATRAVADNRALAAASGIDVERVIRIVWIVATGLAGLSGVLYALVNGGVYWLTGAQLLLLVFAAVTLGGIGTAFGALVGSLIIGVVANMSTLFIPQDLKYATGLVILIVVLLVRPQGILGRRERIG
ncbi:MAG: branched-chain amino acid ABC transporter permease [Pseudolysinimonas sp.]